MNTRIVSGLLLMVAAFTGCMQSPEAKSARYMNAGKSLLQRNEPARAILQFRNAALATPRNPEIYYQLGIAYLAAGDPRNGVRALRRALELYPKHAAARLRLAQLMAGQNSEEILKDAQQQLRSILEDAPDDPNALQALGIAEFKLGQREDAMQHLERAMAAAPRELSLAVTLAQIKLQQNDRVGAEAALQRVCESSPRSADAAVILGSFYAFQKRNGEAEQQFQRALQLEPDHAQALLYLAGLQDETGRRKDAEQTLKRLSVSANPGYRASYAAFLFREGRQEEAIREFERLAKLDPADRQARTRLVAAYRASGKTPEAEKLLGAALGKNAKDLDALLQRAELFTAAGKYDKAAADLNSVLHLRPDSPEAHYAMAQLHAVQGASLMERQELTEALKLNAFLLPVRLRLAEVLLASNAGPSALDTLNETPAAQRAMVVVPRNWVLWTLGDLKAMRAGIDEGLSRQKTPDLLIQDGLWKLAHSNPAGARASLEEALRMSPSDVRALDALRRSYVALDQKAVAVQKVREYAAQHANSAPVQEFLGLVVWAHGDLAQARAAFAAAKAADPAFRAADFSNIQLDVVEKKWEEARSKLQALIRADEKNARARLWLGNLEQARGNQQAALEQYRRVVELEPRNADALNNLAYLLADSVNRPDEALPYAERALELAPQDPGYADTLGWIQYRKGLYPSAVRNLERAAAQEGGSIVWKYHLAMAYAKAGDLRRGRATLESALKRNPNVAEAAAAKQLLAQAK